MPTDMDEIQFQVWRSGVLGGVELSCGRGVGRSTLGCATEQTEQRWKELWTQEQEGRDKAMEARLHISIIATVSNRTLCR